MKSLGFSEQTMNSIWSVLAGVLHLGNIEFTAITNNGVENTSIGNKDPLMLAAKCLGGHNR